MKKFQGRKLERVCSALGSLFKSRIHGMNPADPKCSRQTTLFISTNHKKEESTSLTTGHLKCFQDSLRVLSCHSKTGHPCSSVSKGSTCRDLRRYSRSRFCPWVGKIPWRRKWQLTALFLPGKSHEQRSLAGHSLWGHKSWT